MVLVFGIVLFILAMTITFADVNGINVPLNNDSVTNSQIRGSADPGQLDAALDRNCQDGIKPTPPCPPESVPEPGTLILLAAGLGLGSIKAFRKRFE
jgi:hypothetical protein